MSHHCPPLEAPMGEMVYEVSLSLYCDVKYVLKMTKKVCLELGSFLDL